MSYAFRCEVDTVIPQWRITREGDVVTTWACGEHLSEVCRGLQRDGEQTRLIVTAYVADAT